jgi:hypothetical protein
MENIIKLCKETRIFVVKNGIHISPYPLFTRSTKKYENFAKTHV